MSEAITRPLTPAEREAAEAEARRIAQEAYEAEMEAIKNTVVVVRQ